jgi:diguanylate cyclase (GGDEF)-like protein/putative nucleotidyltransferase with HDIG domain
LSAEVQILIIDPDTEFRSHVAAWLSEQGIHCLQTGGLTEAMAILERKPIKAIISELVFPDSSGLDLLRILTDRNQEIPVIYLTAQGELEWAKTAIRRGAFEYYEKPIELKKLLDILRKALREMFYFGPERRRSALSLQVERIDPTARDELTGLASHHYVLETLPGLYDQCYRQGKPLTLCLIDIEGFRQFNTRQGISAGDLLLIEIGRRLRQIVRTRDIVGRYGNDEFLLVLPGADQKSTHGLMERILKNFQKKKWPTVAENLDVHMCVGVVEVNREENIDSMEFLDRAIEAVYHAKFQGPDSIVAWRPSLSREAPFEIDLEQPDRPVPDYESINIMMWRFRDLTRRLANVTTESLRLLVAAVEARDPYTKHHSVRVADFARCMAMELGLPEAQVRVIHSASLLHDIGKIGVPDAILTKPQKLTGQETDLIRQHPIIAVNILEQARFFVAELPLIKHHHEWYNGNGYPDGLQGESIPLGARIIQVADSSEAMLARRSYKAPFDVGHTLDQIVKGSGEQFDAEIAALAVRLIKEGLLDQIWGSTGKSASGNFLAATKPS